MDCTNAWHRLNEVYLPPDRSEPCPDCKMTETYSDHTGHSDTNQGYEGDLRDAYEKGFDDGWKDGYKFATGKELAGMKVTKKMLAALRLGASDLKDPAKTLLHMILDERKALREALDQACGEITNWRHKEAVAALALGEDE